MRRITCNDLPPSRSAEGFSNLQLHGVPMTSFRPFKTLVAALALGVAMTAQAQDKAPIRILVGFAPGGSTDTVARIIGEKLRGPLGQTVIVENKPGAGGRLAAEALKHSAPDGRTYMLAPNAT